MSWERLAEVSEEEKNDIFWACRAKRWTMFGEGDHSRNDSWVKRTWQTKDDLAQQHHVIDRTWNGRTASEYQQQEGVEPAHSQCDQPSERGWLKKKNKYKPTSRGIVEINWFSSNQLLMRAWHVSVHTELMHCHKIIRLRAVTPHATESPVTCTCENSALAAAGFACSEKKVKA